MSDQDRAIGRLEGKMDLLIGQVSELKQDVKGLTQWKWKIGGGAAVISALVALLAKFI